RRMRVGPSGDDSGGGCRGIRPRSGGCGRSGLQRTLQVERDGDVLADEHAAGLEGGVPGEAEVLPVDDGLRRRTGLVVAPRVGAEAAELEVEGDRLGHPVNGEVAVDEEVAALDADTGRDEVDGRVGLDVEE